MMRNISEIFKRYEGQPVKIFTDDTRINTGIVLESCEDAVRIIDRCGRLKLIELCHIDAVEEPQMELHRCKRFEHEGHEEREEFEFEFESEKKF